MNYDLQLEPYAPTLQEFIDNSDNLTKEVFVLLTDKMPRVFLMPLSIHGTQVSTINLHTHQIVPIKLDTKAIPLRGTFKLEPV